MNDFEGAVSREEMLARVVADRDEIFHKLRTRRPEFKDAYPHQMLRASIRTVCRFRVSPRVLMPGQLAVCDFQQKIVYYNSEIESFVGAGTSIEGLINSTLAHELGHIRLHAEEMENRYPQSFQLANGGIARIDGRDYQREREADLYAVAFLVPGKLLVQESAAQKLYEWHKNDRQVRSSTIWRHIFSLAARFKVTPTLMKRCLFELGWVTARKVSTNGKSELRIRGEV